MSLDKMRVWFDKHGRMDVSEGRSPREREVLDRFCRIALDLDNVVAHQGAKVGKGGEHHDLGFGRMLENRKTPVMFCGILLSAPAEGWQRKGPPPEKDTVRIYVKMSEVGCNRSDWSTLLHDNDTVKTDNEWRYFALPERIPVDGDEMLDLIEDAYFEVVGI